MTEANPIPGKSQPSIPEGQKLGINTPGFIISGVINVDDFATTNELWSETPSTLTSTGECGNSNASRVTLGYLLALWREQVGQNILNVYVGKDYLKWRNWDNSSDDIYVIINSIDTIPDQNTQNGHIINYKITLIEVAPDGTFTA